MVLPTETPTTNLSSYLFGDEIQLISLSSSPSDNGWIHYEGILAIANHIGRPFSIDVREANEGNNEDISYGVLDTLSSSVTTQEGEEYWLKIGLVNRRSTTPPELYVPPGFAISGIDGWILSAEYDVPELLHPETLLILPGLGGEVTRVSDNVTSGRGYRGFTVPLNSSIRESPYIGDAELLTLPQSFETSNELNVDVLSAQIVVNYSDEHAVVGVDYSIHNNDITRNTHVQFEPMIIDGNGVVHSSTVSDELDCTPLPAFVGPGQHAYGTVCFVVPRNAASYGYEMYLIHKNANFDVISLADLNLLNCAESPYPDSFYAGGYTRQVRDRETITIPGAFGRHLSGEGANLMMFEASGGDRIDIVSSNLDQVYLYDPSGRMVTNVSGYWENGHSENIELMCPGTYRLYSVHVRPVDYNIEVTYHGQPFTGEASLHPTSTPDPDALRRQRGQEIVAYCTDFDEIPDPVEYGELINVWWAWIADTPKHIQDHINNVVYEVRLDGTLLEDWASYSGAIEQQMDGNWRVEWSVPIPYPLERGEHNITYTSSWRAAISDGTDTYGPGTENVTETMGCTFDVR